MSFLLPALAGLVLSALAVSVLLPAAPRLGWVDHPGGRKDHPRPTPVIGGAPLLLGAWAVPLGLVPGVPLLLAAGPAGAFLLGLLDDLRTRGCPPLPKLAGQAVAGLFVALALYPATPLAWPGVVLWAALLQNAVNFQDNMDGLAPGAGLGICLLLALLPGPAPARLTAACAGAALLPLLVLNFPRARLFLGDQGSLLLGCTLAALTAWPGAGGRPEAARLVVAAMPLADLALTLLYRLRRRLPPWKAGPHHLSHRLVRRGFSRPGAVVTLWVLTLLAGGGLALLGRVLA